MPDHTADRPAGGPLAAAAYAALTELERVNELAANAPGLAERRALADTAAWRYELYRAALARLGDAEPVEAMAPAAAALDDARRRLRTVDWWEGLAASNLGGALSDELFGTLTANGAPREGSAEEDSAEEGRAEESRAETAGTAAPAEPVEPAWVQLRLSEAVREDPALAARLSLWSRRVVGEAIVLAREFGGDGYPELAARLAANHENRMTALGLEG